MSKNYEDTVADAIINVLAAHSIVKPEAIAAQVRDQIGTAAIRAVAEWNLRYARREGLEEY